MDDKSVWSEHQRWNDEDFKSLKEEEEEEEVRVRVLSCTIWSSLPAQYAG